MGFDFDEQTRRQLGYELIDLINSYYSSLPTRPVQLPAEQRTFGQLSERMPDEGADPALVLALDLGREWAVRGFDQLTTPELKAVWHPVAAKEA